MNALELRQKLNELFSSGQIDENTTLHVIQEEEHLEGQKADQDWWSEVVKVNLGSNWVELVVRKDELL